jgi:hypothetical protein
VELLTPLPGETHVHGRETGRSNPVRYGQRNRVQEDFGDGQVACAMMTLVSGSEPSRSMRRPIRVKSFYSFRDFFFFSASAKLPLSPPFHPHSRSVQVGCSRFRRCCYLTSVLFSPGVSSGTEMSSPLFRGFRRSAGRLAAKRKTLVGPYRNLPCEVTATAPVPVIFVRSALPQEPWPSLLRLPRPCEPRPECSQRHCCSRCNRTGIAAQRLSLTER